MQNAIFLELFESTELSKSDKVIDIFLGTIYDEITTADNGHKLKTDVLLFLNKFPEKPKYIPHPRALDKEFESFKFSSSSIAEEIVFDLIAMDTWLIYMALQVVLQFNLYTVRNVNIYVIDSPWLTSAMKDGISMLANKLPEENHIHI
ncbi:beta-galactosamide-alpha-2,3-sialyltransferase [Enterobacter cloacae]|uniref:Beta-galactosamide-alpha-2,3-sialyltransferase n=1 Tax=Enterobacter cloacae TaxID=550 RepID=A0A377LX35_ENTCL|nr:beta-galactosamide-alpha-2,3-sialyltransferase [Enterobacter cloacae]